MQQGEKEPAKYSSREKTPYVKKSRFKKRGAGATEKSKKKAPSKKKAKKRTQPALGISKELADVVGASSLSRPDIIKKVWEYIKSHNLQDPKNKRLIQPDEKLSKVFGSKTPVDMMKLSGLLNKHIKSWYYPNLSLYISKKQYENIFVFHSERDDVLKYLYLTSELDRALGYKGEEHAKYVPMNVQFIDCTTFVGGHSEYYRTPEVYQFILNQQEMKIDPPISAMHLKLLADGLAERT